MYCFGADDSSLLTLPLALEGQRIAPGRCNVGGFRKLDLDPNLRVATRGEAAKLRHTTSVSCRLSKASSFGLADVAQESLKEMWLCHFP
ncbi:MAG: hypothetical protein V4540_04995 [Pseudomonadota bacterium]